jgi:hypothetical protein
VASEKEPVKNVDNDVRSESLPECTSTPVEEQPAVRKRESESPMWPYPLPNNFSIAVGNIHSTGLSHTLTSRGIASLELLLWEVPWKASDPRHRNNPLITQIASKWRKSLPDLYPILDNFWWKDMDSRPHREEPFPYIMILFGTPSGYFFLYHGKMMNVGTDLEDFMEGVYDDKQLAGEWAEIEGRNLQ